jgi:hypothetical protein
VTSTLLVLYLAAFEGSSSTPWTTPRILAAYALGISLLVLLNGTIAVLCRLACWRHCAAADERVEAGSKAALLPVLNTAACQSILAPSKPERILPGKPVNNSITNDGQLAMATAAGAIEAASLAGDATCLMMAGLSTQAAHSPQQQKVMQ